jgi:hypothetical protein
MNTNIIEKIYTELEKETVLTEGQDVDTIQQLVNSALRFNIIAKRNFEKNGDIVTKSNSLGSVIDRLKSEDDPQTVLRLANYVNLVMTEIIDLSKRGSMNKNPTSLDKFLNEFNHHLELVRTLFDQ